MSWALNNITAPDTAPTPASTLDGLPSVARINLDVTNQPIYWQLKRVKQAGGSWGMATWDDPVFQGPASRSLFRPGTVGIRFWAVTPRASLPAGALQAQVTIEAID